MQQFQSFEDANLPEPQLDSYTKVDWAMYFISVYGQREGEDHKAWVIDQVARILEGSPILVREKRIMDGATCLRVDQEIEVGEPSLSYLDWVERMSGPWANASLGDDGEEPAYTFTYDYDFGVADK